MHLDLFLLLAFFRQSSPCLLPGDFNDKPSPIRYNTKQSVLFCSSRNERFFSMDTNVINELRNGLSAAYINGSVAANLAYKPAFV